jgi:TolB-like protein/Flp pilus assembly protein TadD
VVLKALASTQADRFQTAAEFSHALAGVAATSISRPAERVPDRFPGSRRSSSRLVAVLGIGFLLGLGVLFAWRQFQPRSEEHGVKRIAVLPFQNLNQPGDEYFAAGVTDEVRGKLAALAGMQVIARSSSSRYAESSKNPEEIGRELGVEYLLTGTVRWDKQKAGRSRVRVSPELVHAPSGSTRWQQSFEAPLTDVFQVQGDIAGRVAEALGVELASKQRERLAEKPTENLAAYDLYLRGQHAFHRRTAAGLTEARSFFEQAIARDPSFAPAYAGLADVYAVLPFWLDISPQQTYPRAVAAALQALRLDSTVGRAHGALADVRALYEWNWTAAERGFRRALELDPNNANIHHWYGEDFLIVVGRKDEAVREGQRARELDPLTPVYGSTLAQTLLSIGRYDEALSLVDGIISLDPKYPVAYEARGRVFLHTGRYAEAVRAFQQALELAEGNAITQSLLAYAYTRVARRSDAARLLSKLETQANREYASATALAIVHAGLGDTTAAFRWLETAAEQRDPFLLYFFVVDPILGGLRQHPRGQELLRRLNLPAVR